MLLEKKNILIIENHPFAVEFYKECIINVLSLYNFYVLSDFPSTQKLLHENRYSFAFIDYMSALNEKNSLSILYLIKLLKKKNKDLTIILLLTNNDCDLILKIEEELSPNVFILKKDLTKMSLIKALNNLEGQQIYHSKNIQNCLKNKNSFISGYSLDLRFYRLFFLISRGYSNRNLEEVFSVSNKTILNWKNKIADALNIDISELHAESIKKFNGNLR